MSYIALESAKAWSMYKSDRCKYPFRVKLTTKIVQPTFEGKKNQDTANVGPNTYERHLKDKKHEPQWSMGARIKEVSEKTPVPAPGQYDIPSHISKNGKSMGAKLKGSMDMATLAPGPGAYNQEKEKMGNLQYSMGSKLKDLGRMNVPGPGAYDESRQSIEVQKNVRFGKDKRPGMAKNNNSPGPGAHSPDFKKGVNTAPQFGFGSENRDGQADLRKNFPGPGNYKLNPLIGDGLKSSMHATIDYTPARKEQSYKPGPGNYDPDALRTKNKMP